MKTDPKFMNFGYKHLHTQKKPNTFGKEILTKKQSYIF